MKSYNYILNAIFFLIWILLAGQAQGATTITTIGEAAISNITPEEAQNLALQRARHEAVSRVCGVQVQAETLVKNFSMAGDFIHSVSYGRIVNEDVLKWELDVEQPSPTKPAEMVYRVTLRSEVQEEKGEPDPFYKVKVWLNKQVFENGEEMIVNVSSTKEGYITVLNFSADGTVTLLYPNKLRRDNKVEPNKEYQIPAKEDRGSLMTFQVATLPGHKRDTEFIKVISTRGPVNLFSEVKAHGNYGVMDSTKFAVTEIARLMASIPPKSRAEDTASYQIINPRLQ
ncbi:MAG: DUF4384 domain-containing protein [Proteobacteria bacterium]|nr:DUF4384 domain-containing protein [Pseudomonadota bacterium]MBU1738585.1 DUF4384 domain-containing protein [Pseudomonadota bacterium]